MPSQAVIIVTILVVTFAVASVLSQYYPEISSNNQRTIGGIISSQQQITTTTINLHHRLAIVHIAGGYPQIGADYLVYGATDAKNLGFQGIEIYLSKEICGNNSAYPNGYYQTLDWCNENDMQNITSLASHPRYKEVFNLPVNTYFLTTAGVMQGSVTDAGVANRWKTRFNQSQLDKLYKDFYGFTEYLLRTYQNTGKTFILQSSNEMDWKLLGNKLNKSADPDDFAIQNAIDYWNTIQKAIDDAKRDNPSSGVWIYHSCEVNLLVKAMNGRKTATNDVVPNTKCDLYSYSSWDTALSSDNETFVRALNYLAEKAPDSKIFGNKNIYISELGVPENGYTAERAVQIIDQRIKQAINWGIPYILYWQIYGHYWIREPSGNLSEVYNQVFLKYETRANDAQFIFQNVPANMLAGKNYVVSITMRNTGTTKWNRSANYRLGSQNPRDNLIWSISRVELENLDEIAPGQTKTFNFSIKAPSTIGTYNFSWRMVQEKIEWFGDFTPNIIVTVIPTSTTTTTPTSTTTTTTSTTPPAQFSSTSFTNSSISGGYNISLSYSKTYTDNVTVIFIFTNSSGSVSYYTTRIASLPSGRIYSEILCSILPSGRYSVSWIAFLSSDTSLVNPIAWSKSKEIKLINC